MTAPQEMLELLPCPFCGGRGDFNNDGERWWQVICQSCGGRGCEFPSDKEKATAFWNRRAEVRLSASPAGNGGREFKDGDPLVTELIWEVDRAVKQAIREGGRYETALRFILNKHLTPAVAPDGAREQTTPCTHPDYSDWDGSQPEPRPLALPAVVGIEGREALERETVQILLDLLNPLHGDLDKQTYDAKVAMEFDMPPDYAHDVTVTAQQERDLTQAVLILENRKRDPQLDRHPHQPVEDKRNG